MRKNTLMYFLSLIFIFLSVVSSYSQSGSTDTIKISDDLVLIKITNNAYIHISYKYYEGYGRVPNNGVVYITSGNAYIMDTPVNDELTLELITWLTDKIKVSVEGVIVNHWHVDCMGGLNQVHKSGIKSYAYELTCEIADSKNLPVPQISFKDSLVISAGDKEIICKYFGGGHTEDNIVIWIPEEEVLFAGCMVKSLSAQSLGNTRDADMENYKSTIEKVLNRFSKAKIVIPGHGSHGGTELLTHTLKLLKGNSPKNL